MEIKAREAGNNFGAVTPGIERVHISVLNSSIGDLVSVNIQRVEPLNYELILEKEWPVPV